MKKNFFLRFGIFSLVMVFSLGFSLSAKPVKENPNKTYDVTLSLTNATVKSFSEAFTKETGVLFSYESAVAQKQLGRVALNEKNASLESILDKVFKKDSSSNFSYEVVNSTVVVTYQVPQVSKPTTVRGTVVSATGEPLIGAGVFIKGTDKGVTTDLDGAYSIEASASDILVFSYIGCKDAEEYVNNRNLISVTLYDDVTVLDDVIVVGYGTQSRKTLTTSIAKVSGDALENAPVSNVGEALKGKVTGLRIASNNTLAGESPRMLIRGGSSISLSNDPIVIVDGVTRDMSTINPNDIESIEVLKDAASASIYGARASNGVILVTTKKGAAHKGPQITFDSSVGFTSPSRKWDLMNAEEYLTFLRPAIKEALNGPATLLAATAAGTGNTETSQYTTRYLLPGEEVPAGWKWVQDPVYPDDPTKILIFTDTDYQSQIFRPALWHREYVGVNGGNQNMKYAASISYLEDDGMVLANDYSLFTMHGNTSFKIVKNLEASTTFDFSRSNQTPLTDHFFNAIGRSLLVAPTHRDYDEDGKLLNGGRGGTAANQCIPEHWATYYKRARITNKFVGNFRLKWDITKDLTAVAQYALYDNAYVGSYYTYGEVDGVKNPLSQTRSTTETRDETLRHSFQSYLNFDKSFGKHSVNATAGFDYMHWKKLHFTANSTGSVSDKVPVLQSGINFTAENYERNEALMSAFGRFNYNYSDRYIASFTFRADGSSKFAPGNRWGFFPAGSVAWVVSEEPFWTVDSSKMNFLKLRASYGQTGNNGIGLFDTYGSYSTDNPYNGLATTLPSAMMNSGLKWETTTQLDIGLDLNFLNDRLRFVFDYYDKVTNNMLFSVTLPDTGSFGSVKANVGSARFYGFEAEVHSMNIHTRNFTWSTDFTYSFSKNKVLSLPDEYKYTDINGKDAWRIGGYTLSESGERFGGTAVGEPLGRIYGYKISHIIQTEAEADAAYYDAISNGYRRSDGVQIKGRKDVGDYEYLNRPGSALTPDGKEQINAEDMFELGNVMPHSTGGLGNTFTYKNWALNIYVDYAIGHHLYNYMFSRFMQNSFGTYTANMDKEVYKTWKYPGDTKAKYARFTANDADYGNKNFSRANDMNVQKGDYLCLRDVSLSYTFPEKWMRKTPIKRLTLGVSGNTLAYWTGVSGSVSPETGMGTGGGDNMYSAVSTGGSSNSSLAPAARKVLFNIKITF